MTPIERDLIQSMEAMEIIDAHEHLPPESHRTDLVVDVFTLFRHYTRGDFMVAGMSNTEYDSLFDQSIPLDKRWATFAPYYELIRFGSYSRAAQLACEAFYGETEINESNYAVISARMKEANKPGLYERVLRDACKIRTALTQVGLTDLGSPLLTPVMPLNYDLESGRELANPPFAPEANINSLDGYLEAVFEYLARSKAEGCVGLKMWSSPYETVDREEANRAFNRLLTGEIERLPTPNPLRDFVVDQIIEWATREGLVICVHTGYWGDFRTVDPTHMIPLLMKHPDARFDIYHLGYPWVREAIMLGKGFPNVWLNLCWTHIISQSFVRIALEEMLDMIPMNKIIAFGGDYNLPVEKVYGHLVMARENIARVLAGRIERGLLNESDAQYIIKRWFWDNPVELYGLKV